MSYGPVGGPDYIVLLFGFKFLSIILRERLCILLWFVSYVNIVIAGWGIL